jgi:hypothetical protein
MLEENAVTTHRNRKKGIQQNDKEKEKHEEDVKDKQNQNLSGGNSGQQER